MKIETGQQMYDLTMSYDELVAIKKAVLNHRPGTDRKTAGNLLEFLKALKSLGFSVGEESC